MKKIITKILKSAVFLAFVFAGAQFADASSFVSDPWANGNGITSAGSTGAVASSSNTLNVSGDENFYVFITYQNKENYNLVGVEAMLDFPTSGASSSTTIMGRLGATNGTTESDSVSITGLPANWDLEITDLGVMNVHGTTDVDCVPSSNYAYEITMPASLIDNSWASLPGGAAVLDTFLINTTNGYTGGCDQGFVAAKFRITETTGAGTSTPVIDTNNATSVTDTTAQLHGEVLAGTITNPYFRYNDGSVSCTTGASIYLGGSESAGDTYSASISGLTPNTLYNFIACGEDGGAIISGDVENFTTDDDGSGGSGTGTGTDEEPDADTLDEDNVDEDSAELNGEVDMNDFDDGLVFFAYGDDPSDLDTFIVETDLDGSDSFSLDVDGLDPDTVYFYQICVAYDNDGTPDVECGSLESFTTDSDGSGGSGTGDDDSIIETRVPEVVGSTSVKMCGELLDDGGDSGLRTWIEYRKATSGTWEQTDDVPRGEVYYCVTVAGLDAGTAYKYRACSEDGCGLTYNLTTAGTLVSSATDKPLVSTEAPTSIKSNSAVLNGFYVSNASSATVWFNYGRTPALGKQTQTYTKFGAHGYFLHNFTNLASNTTYYYQAVAQNSKGTAVGNILSFRTGDSGSVVVVEELEEEIDLSSLGLGLSLVRLEIDDDREQVVRGENLEYEVTWENISTLDLEDIDLKITLPEEVQITNTSRGVYDADQNAIFYTIDELEDGEDGDLTIFGTVVDGSLGNALTAEATLAFDNPVNGAQENATDYDVDEFVVRTSLGTASVFGLGNISFLGWLVILLGLLIVFLVARWLYLEREELRAQAYANGYGRPAPMPAPQNHYNYAPPAAPQAQAPVQLEYQAPVAQNNVPPVQEDPGYKPYRPNR